MKKTTKGKKKKEHKRWILVMVLLFTYAFSAGASYLFLKDKFAFESTFITEIEARQALSEHKKKTKQTGRLYETKGSVAAVKSGSVPRKDRMLVIAEDSIRKLVEDDRLSRSFQKYLVSEKLSSHVWVFSRKE